MVVNQDSAAIFLSLLIDRVQETMGNVADCSIVMSAMNNYRKAQDAFTQFFDEKIIKNPGGTITTTNVQEDFKIWYQENCGPKVPQAKDLNEYLDSKLGRRKGKVWKGYELLLEDEKEPDDTGNEP